MFSRISVLPVINKVAGACPMTKYVSGIFHSNGGTFLKFTVNRFWVSRTFPSVSPLNRHDWKSGLLRPASSDVADRFLGRFREGIPQICGRRVRIFMRDDVPPNSIAEHVFAQKTLQHSQKR